MFLMMRYISGLRSFQRVWSSRSKRHLLQGGGVIAIPMSQSPRVSSTGSSTSLILLGDAMNRAQFNHFFLRNPRAAKQVVGQVDTGYFSPSDIDQMTTPSQKDQSSDDDFWGMVFGGDTQGTKDQKTSDFDPWDFDYSGQGQTQTTQTKPSPTSPTTKQQAPIPGLTQQKPVTATTGTSSDSGWLKWGLLSALAATGIYAATSMSEEPKKTTRRRRKKRKYRRRGKRR